MKLNVAAVAQDAINNPWNDNVIESYFEANLEYSRDGTYDVYFLSSGNDTMC